MNRNRTKIPVPSFNLTTLNKWSTPSVADQQAAARREAAAREAEQMRLDENQAIKNRELAAAAREAEQMRLDEKQAIKNRELAAAARELHLKKIRLESAEKWKRLKPMLGWTNDELTQTTENEEVYNHNLGRHRPLPKTPDGGGSRRKKYRRNRVSKRQIRTRRY
jgi:hypothetical protein